MTKQESLFELPEREERTLVFKPIRHPLWTENKARLIARYLYYFVLITKHGAYIDGFAAPQNDDLRDNWSAKLVLQSEPKFLRDFWLCDINRSGIRAIREMVSEQPVVKGRTINILQGDFNKKIDEVLASGRIKPSTAVFCLLDQRTFECEWSTLTKLASYKCNKEIELFYFLGTGWMERAFSGIKKNKDTVKAWWGRDDWENLRALNGTVRADAFCQRFRSELGYAYAHAWPIYERGSTGKSMYHMIHCSDHEEAPKLMSRAYRTATRAPEPATQLELEFASAINEAKQEQSD
jgi:three-Cys-motif partner protein